MAPRRIEVFLYGLFMEADLLRAKGVNPTNSRPASVPGFALRSRRRSRLRRDPAPVQLFCEIAIGPGRNDPELCGPLGVDHERVRLWTFARAAAEPRDDWSNGDLVAP